MRALSFRVLVASAAASLLATLAPAEPPGRITIQGTLTRPDGRPATETRAYRVRFYNAQTGGTQIGLPITGNTSFAADGRFSFTVALPEEAAFATALWYEFTIDSNNVPDGLDTSDIFPNRIEVTSVPYAIFSRDALTLDGKAATTFATAQELATRAPLVHTHSASDIVSGTLSIDRLPAEVATDADVATRAPLVHTHSASEIVSGVLSIDRLPTELATDAELATRAPLSHSHSAADITSGVLDDARISSNIARVSQIASTLDAAYDGGNTITADVGPVIVNGTGGIRSEAVVESRTGFRLTLPPNGTQKSAELSRDENGGNIEAFNENGGRVVNIQAATDGEGGTGAFYMNNTNLIGVGVVGDPAGNNSGGQVSVFSQAQLPVANLATDGAGGGRITAVSAANKPVTIIGVNGGGGGFVSLQDAGGLQAAVMTQNQQGDGAIATIDVQGNVQAGIFGNAIIATTKSFIAPDPQRADRLIRYISLEGPEAGMYTRGTAELHSGAATIELPEHFAALANGETVTVSLTPRSADSLGLAAVEVGARQIVVRELHRGTGSYKFDYTVTAIRKGFENHEVYMPREALAVQGPAGDPIAAPAGTELLR